VKGYISDRAFDICSQGLQVFGGYGFIRDYPMEQLLRDCRITMIYEGANGIQAMDLVGRKLPMNKGKTVMEFMGELQKTVFRAKAIAQTNDLAGRFEKAVKRMGDVGMHMFKLSSSKNVLNAFAFAYPFMDVVGDVSMAWMHLQRAAVASEALKKGSKKSDYPFYQGVVRSAEFFIRTILPVTIGRMEAILDNCGAVVEIEEDSFGGK
jgi:hypothetical protein